MRCSLLLMAIVLLSQCEKEETFIDASPSFLNALIQRGIDMDEDGEISLSEARAVSKLDITNEPVSDLTGIQSFSNLDTLICRGTQLTSVDISKNTGLLYFRCSANSLTSLDVSKNTSLKYLNCGVNQLTDLDISGNTALTTLNCDYCDLPNLDISMNPELVNLYCSGNQFSMLDVSGNDALTTLDCSYCNLTDLDVSMNHELLVLHCGGNQLTMLDVSINTVLYELYINEMPSLHKLCVDVRPFPLINVYVYSAGSPNVYYATDCSK